MAGAFSDSEREAMEEAPRIRPHHPMRPTSTATPSSARQTTAPGVHCRRAGRAGDSNPFASGMPARAGNGGEATNQMRQKPRKEEPMKYQKPKVVAKSAPKQSFAAGCPVKTPSYSYCYDGNKACMCGQLN